jgi:hypothetical protein
MGTGLILIAIGAILAFAVDFQTTGIDINAIGAILIVVGLIGVLFSFLALGDSGMFWGRSGHTDHYVEERGTSPHTHQRVEQTDVVVEDDRTGTVDRVERVRRVR